MAFRRLRRSGKLYFSAEFVESGKISDLFKALEFTPLTADYDFHEGRIRYIGCSPRFEEVQEGEATPLYALETQYMEGELFVNVTRTK